MLWKYSGCIHERIHMITVLIKWNVRKLIIIDGQTNHQSLETQGTLSQCTRMQATAAATSGCVVETIYIPHVESGQHEPCCLQCG